MGGWGGIHCKILIPKHAVVVAKAIIHRLLLRTVWKIVNRREGNRPIYALWLQGMINNAARGRRVIQRVQRGGRIQREFLREGSVAGRGWCSPGCNPLRTASRNNEGRQHVYLESIPPTLAMHGRDQYKGEDGLMVILSP